MKRIPLTGKYGRDKYAIVDDEDFIRFGYLKWYCHKTGYATRSKNLGNHHIKTFKLHRLITNAPENLQVDHINGNRLDNRKSNLRLVTANQNRINRKPNRGNKFRGVHYEKHKKLYRVTICFNKRRYSFGRFKSQHLAALMYDFWATKIYGEYARTNFKVIAKSD